VGDTVHFHERNEPRVVDLNSNDSMSDEKAPPDGISGGTFGENRKDTLNDVKTPRE
jgi:hypothetical protein